MSSLAPDDFRGVEIFPPFGASNQAYRNTWLEDDGLSAVEINHISEFVLEYESFATEVHVKLEQAKDNVYGPGWKSIMVVLPVNDDRVVISNTQHEAIDMGRDAKGRRRFEIML